MSGAARSLSARSALLLTSLALGGCFFYDSSWGQAKASQKRVAAERMPSQLRRDAPARTSEHFRIRAYATPHYATALVDGEAQFVQALEDANPTLASDLAFQLELSDYRVWSNAVADDDLKLLLDAIEKEDAARDVDWVVILASPRHMVAVSADQLGMGRLFGRHLAIRAMSDSDEFDAIEQSFSELSEDEKRKLYAARKRHKAATVLLHELGHTLGMPHELERHALMSAHYDLKSRAFGGISAQLGRRALDLRATTPGSALHRSAARAALDALMGAPPHTFEEQTARDVEQLLRLQSEPLQAEAAAPATAESVAPPGVASAASPPPAPGGLAAGDHALFQKAQKAQAAGDVARARALAAPLFARYPENYAVQELRCQLAMKAGLSMSEEAAECQPLIRLSGSAL
jgi:hypothetical protein